MYNNKEFHKKKEKKRRLITFQKKILVLHKRLIIYEKYHQHIVIGLLELHRILNSQGNGMMVHSFNY